MRHGYLPAPEVQAWVAAHPLLAASLAMALLAGLAFVVWVWVRLPGR